MIRICKGATCLQRFLFNMWIESKIPVTSIISRGLPGNSREKYRYQTNVVLTPSHIRWWVEQLPGPMRMLLFWTTSECYLKNAPAP